MNKKGRMFVVFAAVMVQLMLGVLYGFSMIPVPAGICFLIWCACAAMILKVTEALNTV